MGKPSLENLPLPPFISIEEGLRGLGEGHRPDLDRAGASRADDRDIGVRVKHPPGSLLPSREPRVADIVNVHEGPFAVGGSRVGPVHGLDEKI